MDSKFTSIEGVFLMRNIFVLALLSLTLTALAGSTPELSASLLTNGITGFNCNPSGGPAEYKATFLIENNETLPMYINYSYYDFNSGQMLQGGRACIITPGTGERCTVSSCWP